MDRIEQSLLRGAIGVAMAFGLASRSARGESRLEYRVPADCPSEAAFVQSVAARGGRFDRPTAYDDGRVMEVAVARQGEGYTGSFRARRAGVISASRDVHGTTCLEVVDALAVVVGIALRPAEEESPDAPGAVTSAPAEPVVRPPAPNRPRPEPARQARQREPEPALKTTFSNTFPSPFAPGDKEIDVESGKLRFQSVVSVTAFGGVAVGMIPGLVMPRIDSSVSVASFVTPPGASSYMVGPLWRIRLSLLADVKYRSGDLTTEAGGQAAGLSLCYSPYFDAEGLGILFCSEVGAVAMQLRTTDASGARVQSKRQGTGTVGLGVELPYNIGRHFQVALKLGGDVVTSPFTAERADGSQIFESPWLSGYAAIGLGGHW